MDYTKLTAADLIDQEVGASCGFFKSLKYTTAAHYHDFFEFFLITEGCVTHIVNSQRQRLEKGALVFIRPDDLHYYERIEKKGCQFLNLGFLQDIAYSLFRYLGLGFNPDRLLQTVYPPTIRVRDQDLSAVQGKLASFIPRLDSDKSALNLELRILILELFTKYFPAETATMEKSPKLPDWLDNLCIEMKKRENFTAGTRRMPDIACRSHEHICHVFKKYLNLTPTDFVNDLRLNFASNLLLYSNHPILEISQDAGFENLSHFYHQFQGKFGLSPARYRKLNKKLFVPDQSTRK